LHGVRTGETTEEGDLHIGNDGCRSDDKTFYADQLVGICGMSCLSNYP
jgi:hypothetical protein